MLTKLLVTLHLNDTPVKFVLFAEICILTIQRGNVCVCVFPIWGHIDAAFRLLALEYVSVGIEGRTAQTGSHLNK